jgi:hypothetical protein
MVPFQNELESALLSAERAGVEFLPTGRYARRGEDGGGEYGFVVRRTCNTNTLRAVLRDHLRDVGVKLRTWDIRLVNHAWQVGLTVGPWPRPTHQKIAREEPPPQAPAQTHTPEATKS